MNVRQNWRIILLVVLIAASAVVLFVPGATLGGGSGDSGGPVANGSTGTSFDNVSAGTGVTSGDGLTNIQYGIQLEGGSRIRAPISGMMVDELTIDPANAGELEQRLARALDVPEIDVDTRIRETEGQDAVEVVNTTVTAEQFATALSAEGFSVATEDVQDRVTDETREDMVEIVERKVSASALSGVSVQGATTPTGNYFVVIESVGRDIGDLRTILEERGVVNVFAYHEAGNGTWIRTHALSQDQFASIGNVRRTGENEFGVSVTVTESGAQEFQNTMQSVGFTSRTVCQSQRFETTGCMQTELNGEVIFNASIQENLASSFASGEFANDPTFTMTVPTRENARNLELSLKTGRPLPAPLNFTSAQTTQLEPSLAERFKSNSVVVGLAAVLTVSLVVYYRYRDARVAAPMVVTALSEVFLLLGFVALVQYPLNLAHIAGFIAVIGTGVDDLVIIADEVLQQEGVTTGRVFQNRFRKAFWVIGAAAATTILAMSPLMVLSLGDLSGFAIITIFGVLIGIAVTRPAYGDILRYLILDE